MREDFRFFDNRQKYLLFVTTTNEKNVVSSKISKIIEKIKPTKPALKIFDAGLGDGTLLMNIIKKSHNVFPTIPFLVVGKEISLEDVRLCVEKLSDRFIEHPNMVFVVTNLHYNEAASFSSKNSEKNKNINWDIVKLKGTSSFSYSEQLNKLDEILKKNWQVERHQVSGNPTYKLPSVLVIYREDHEINLDNVIPKNDGIKMEFDLIIASQPYRSRISVKQKVKYVVEPMINALKLNGKLVLIHACGNNPGHEIINLIWPEEDPFPSSSNDIIKYLEKNLSKELQSKLNFSLPEKFKYSLRALPNEIENGISTSLIFSSWNASTYVGQISDSKIAEKEKDGKYVDYIKKIIKNHDGLWFTNELLQIDRTED